MLYIVIASVLVYLINLMDQTNSLLTFLAFHPILILRYGQVWRLITWIFIPLNNNLFFVALALYFYYFIGSSLEHEWGTGKFTIYYLSGVAMNIIYGLLAWFILGVAVPIAPNFLNLSMFFAFAVLFPDHVIRLFFVIPIKIKWLALFNAFFFLLSIIVELFIGSVFIAMLPLVALLNFIVICGDSALAYLRPLKTRANPQTINFRRAAKQAKRAQNNMPYRHKCAVCGKTDADYPGMEFRYCSRCEGYHCFCSEHINNHIHFQ